MLIVVSNDFLQTQENAEQRDNESLGKNVRCEETMPLPQAMTGRRGRKTQMGRHGRKMQIKTAPMCRHGTGLLAPQGPARHLLPGAGAGGC